MLKSVIVWLTLLALAWFAADIIDKGQVLNQLTPRPIFGWILWGICALVVWWLLLWPVIQFCMLRSIHDCGLHKRLELACSRMRKYRGHADTCPEQAALYDELYNASINGREDDEAVRLLVKYQAIGDHPRMARQLILRYSKAAGVAVVFSRNNVVDALALVVVQMKMVVGLARLYGYKPSPVFNALCFCWVLAHSLLFALTSGAVTEIAADAVSSAAGQAADMAVDAATDLSVCLADTILEDPSLAIRTTNSIAEKIPLADIVSSAAKVVAKPLAEAFLAALPVYVTGHIFLRQLEHEQTANFRTLLKLRRAAYKDLFKSFSEAAVSAIKSRKNRAEEEGRREEQDS